MSIITINGNSLDPAAQTVRALGLEAADASESNYILVQTTGGSLKKDQKSILKEKGVDIQEYVSKDTYLCGYKPKDLSAIRDLDFIQYANIYLPQFVVQPSLKTEPGNPVIGFQSVTSESGTGSRTPRNVDIVLHKDVEFDEAIKSQIATAAHADVDSIQVNRKDQHRSYHCHANVLNSR